jgi:hypothetical protein
MEAFMPTYRGAGMEVSRAALSGHHPPADSRPAHVPCICAYINGSVR